VRIAHAQRLIGNVMLDIREMHILLVFQWKNSNQSLVQEHTWRVKVIGRYLVMNARMGIKYHKNSVYLGPIETKCQEED
jgi:hypothetical protein